MLQNAYLLAKIGADTAENELHFADILPIGRRVADALAGQYMYDQPFAPPTMGREYAALRVWPWQQKVMLKIQAIPLRILAQFNEYIVHFCPSFVRT